MGVCTLRGVVRPAAAHAEAATAYWDVAVKPSRVSRTQRTLRETVSGRAIYLKHSVPPGIGVVSDDAIVITTLAWLVLYVRMYLVHRHAHRETTDYYIAYSVPFVCLLVSCFGLSSVPGQCVLLFPSS
ncbi:hypothetical protein B0T24DRAFT_306942 [Lasiosphaeria ovina]|uniref:Uncharacterized protein n=1 Tax=Lasiosphaeria ovina TaxID=92902 RepID=A0AAE0K6X3_9PEZI|nr:hypothetical protein B0T24DRAFT_306942 [Lasiosphaeria ovina]